MPGGNSAQPPDQAKTKELFGRWSGTVEKSYSNIYHISQIGVSRNLEKFMKEADKELEEHKSDSDGPGPGQMHVLMLQYHKDLLEGALHFVKKEFDAAVECVAKSKKCMEEIKQSDTDGRIPDALSQKMSTETRVYLAMIDVMRGDQENGMAALWKAQDQAKTEKNPYGQALAAHYIALGAEKGKDPNAKYLYQHALRIAQKAGIDLFIWRGYFHIGRFAMANGGDVDEAIKNFQASLDIIEAEFAKIEQDVKMTAFMGDKRQVYDAMKFALLKKGNVEQAFEIAEKVKYRALLELLSSKSAGSNAGKKFVTLQAVQAALDEKTAILKFDQNESTLCVWLITHDSIQAQQIEQPGEKLGNKIRSLLMILKSPQSKAVYGLLGDFYELLLGHFTEAIQGKDLIVIPDGPLNYLPFAALRDKEGKFLVQNHSITVVPSAGILLFGITRRESVSNSILAFGNPDLGDPKMNLPHAELEAKGIAEKHPKTKLFLAKDATETAAKNAMPDFGIIHFACHGEMDAVSPLHSCLRLTPDANNDGKLTASEIYDLRLKAQLVVMSACETGQGTMDFGDEVVGLPRCLLNAGASSVLASFWKVDDNATSLLMNALYDALSGSGKAQALQKAQIATMQVKKHPYYWASFYLVGDGKQRIELKQVPKTEAGQPPL